ncbi:MAG: methylmalonyl Co-A mutase-associated GTPase MeaB [Oligoflexia bacterium]|nr:methylmalonyl Co-A mutase-associated GTPase MeaB [Oligoflexia bacterium]
MAPKESLSSLIKQASLGDIGALARSLTFIERDLKGSLPQIAKLKASKKSLRIGITGPPGAGKSTLVNLLIKNYRKDDYKIGVLAVDPSSPFSGGALLGDRIRMNEHSADSNVFIRSIGSRGGVGGLSAASGAMARVLEYCGFDLILIETVGVGQTELEIMNLAHATAVILVPESGDVIQTLKAGILEIADVFIVNKSDRVGADILAQELKNLVEQESKTPRNVFLTSANRDEGIVPLAKHLLELALKFKNNSKRVQVRNLGQLRALVLASWDQELQKKISKLKIQDPFITFSKFK